MRSPPSADILLARGLRLPLSSVRRCYKNSSSHQRLFLSRWHFTWAIFMFMFMKIDYTVLLRANEPQMPLQTISDKLNWENECHLQMFLSQLHCIVFTLVWMLLRRWPSRSERGNTQGERKEGWERKGWKG